MSTVAEEVGALLRGLEIVTKTDEPCPGGCGETAHSEVSLLGGPKVLVPCRECLPTYRQPSIPKAVALRPDPIDSTRFAYWWTLWCEKWRKTGENTYSKQYRSEFYRGLLGKLDNDQFERAAAFAFRGGRWFPDVVTIIRLGHGLPDGREHG